MTARQALKHYRESMRRVHRRHHKCECGLKFKRTKGQLTGACLTKVGTEIYADISFLNK
jgi:hypothetical protein